MKKLVKLFFIILILSFTIYSVNSFASTNELADKQVVNETNDFENINITSNNEVNVNNVNENTEVSKLNEDNENNLNTLEVTSNSNVEDSSKNMELLAYQDGLVKIGNDWRVVINGKIDYNYTGIATNQNGTWFVQNGTIKYDYTGHYTDKNGKTYIIEKNKVMTNLKTVMKIDNVWRMVINGVVDYNYTGIGTNELGTWFVEKGKVTFKYTGTYYEGDKAYIIEESKVFETVTKSTTEVMKINNIWRMVIKGKVDYNYNGIGSNSLGTWLIQNGTVTFKYTGIDRKSVV